MKNSIKYISIFLICFELLSSGVALALVDNIPPTIPKPTTLPGPFTTEEDQAKSQDNKALVFSLLPRFATTSIGFVTITAFLMTIIGGIRFMTMYGNDEAVEKGKKAVIYALVGLVIALLAYAIVVIVSNIDFNPPISPR
jgi:hypothetical protein